MGDQARHGFPHRIVEPPVARRVHRVAHVPASNPAGRPIIAVSWAAACATRSPCRTASRLTQMPHTGTLAPSARRPTRMPAWVSARPEAQTTVLNPTPTTGTWWRRTRARVHDAARLRVQATNSLILDFKKPVARDALLRVSEIAALDVADVSLAEQTVVIRRSKTDQEGAGAVQFLGKPTVERIRTWLRASGLAAGALFRVVNKSGRVYGERLTARSIRSIITRRARAAGVEGRVSGHSLRVGSAQSLATAGASLVEMQVAGRWESPNMPGHYAQGQLARQGAVARLRYGTSWTPHDPPAP